MGFVVWNLMVEHGLRPASLLMAHVVCVQIFLQRLVSICVPSTNVKLNALDETQENAHSPAASDDSALFSQSSAGSF